MANMAYIHQLAEDVATTVQNRYRKYASNLVLHEDLTQQAILYQLIYPAMRKGQLIERLNRYVCEKILCEHLINLLPNETNTTY